MLVRGEQDRVHNLSVILTGGNSWCHYLSVSMKGNRSCCHHLYVSMQGSRSWRHNLSVSMIAHIFLAPINTLLALRGLFEYQRNLNTSSGFLRVDECNKLLSDLEYYRRDCCLLTPPPPRRINRNKQN